MTIEGRPPAAGDALRELRRLVESPARTAEPRHARLRLAILDLVAEGLWAAGDKLPPETALANAAGLSLGTAQKALAQLARDGALVRRHGHGTFVASDGAQSDRLIHFRFIGDDGRAIAPVFAEAIDRRVIEQSGPWSAYLPDAARFIRVRRRINVADEFDCVSDFYVDAERYAPLLDLPLEELHRVVIRQVLAERFDTPTVAVDQRVYASRFPDEIGRLMKLGARHCFGLVLEVRSSTRSSRPFAFQNVFIPPDVRPLKTLDPRLFTAG